MASSTLTADELTALVETTLFRVLFGVVMIGSGATILQNGKFCRIVVM